jgi:pimeloyl-ACP methyl ester carboxylesterase
MCGDWPGPTAVAPPPAVKIAFRSDAIMWLATTLAGPALLRFVAGVPRKFDVAVEDRAKARRMVEIMFPVRERSEGVLFDAFRGNADVNDYLLERIGVPTLIVHAQDDTMASYASAAAAAIRIPSAHLVTHARGGHLMLGQQIASRAAVLDFLGSSEDGHEGRPEAV